MLKVSIIIPNYNKANYIVRCIESIKKQTYQNIECILVDDASDDDSILLIKKCLEDYQGPIEFIIQFNEKNEGLSETRNKGTLKSTGDYIYYLDSDDELPVESIEKLVEPIYRYGDVELVHGNMKTIPEPLPEDDWKNLLYKDFPGYVNDNLWVREHFYTNHNGIPPNACNKLIKRSFLFDNNLFFLKGIVHEDELWMFNVVKFLAVIAFVKEYTYYRYIIPGSITQRVNQTENIWSLTVVYNEILKGIDNPLSKCQKNKYLDLLYSRMRFEELCADRKNFYQEYKKVAIENSIRELRQCNLSYIIHLIIFITPSFLRKTKIYRKVYNLFFYQVFRKGRFI